MRHRRLSLVGAIIGLTGLMAAPAMADSHAEGGAAGASGFEHLQKGITVDGFLGAHIFSGNNEIGQIDRADADSPQHAFAFGVRVGYALNWVFSIEGEAGFMPTTADSGEANLFAIGWRAHALFHVLPGRIQQDIAEQVSRRPGESIRAHDLMLKAKLSPSMRSLMAGWASTTVQRRLKNKRRPSLTVRQLS